MGGLLEEESVDAVCLSWCMMSKALEIVLEMFLKDMFPLGSYVNERLQSA